MVAQCVGFYTFSWFFEADGRYMQSFFFSSLLCPIIRHYEPKNGDYIVYGVVVSVLTGAYLWDGLGAFFWGIFFLQALGEVQRHLWWKPELNMMFVCTVKDTTHIFFLDFFLIRATSFSCALNHIP